MYLIHLFAGRTALFPFDHPAGHAHHSAVGGHLLKNYRPGPYFGILTHSERTQNLRPRAHHHIILQRGVPLSGFFSRTSQGHTLVQGHIIPDNRRLSNDHTASVVNEQPFADCGARVNLDPGLPGRPLGNQPCQEVMLLQIQFMCAAVLEHNPEAGIQKHLPGGLNRRVSLLYHRGFFLKKFPKTHAVTP